MTIENDLNLDFGESEAIVLALRKDSILLSNDFLVKKRCKDIYIKIFNLEDIIAFAIEKRPIKNRRVYILNGYLAEPACRSFIGAYYCASWFYPDQFQDLNPEEIHREYFEEWLDVGYKGIWIYPAVS